MKKHKANVKTGRVKVRLFARLLISYMAIFVLVSYSFAFLLGKYYINYEATRALRQSWGALAGLNDYYEEKHKQFADTILPLFEMGGSYYIDGLLLSEETELLNEPLKRMELADVFTRVAERDSDIRSVFLYGKKDEACYIYSVKHKTLQTANSTDVFFSEMADLPNKRITFGTRYFGENVYAVGGTIGQQRNDGTSGNFLLIYRTEAFSAMLGKYPDRIGRFLLLKENGDVIYDSEGNYGGMPYSDFQLVLSGEEFAQIDGKDFHIQTMEGQRGNVVAVNLVPANLVAGDGTGRAIYGWVTLINIICLVLFAVSGTMISRRLNKLTLAMEKAGPDNLSYRIPVGKSKHEFSELAEKFNHMCDELQEMIFNEYISEINKKNAQLDALQAGINPHFLYNTLEAIRVLALEGEKEDISAMIVNLAGLYRAIVQDDTFISIGRELNLCEMYVNIFLFRYDSALEYELIADEGIKEFGIPKNILQPIIENYFVHGIDKNSENNVFSIRGYIREDDIIFELEDNGSGLSARQLEEVRKAIHGAGTSKTAGYGLPNIQKRIRLIYGPGYGVSIDSIEGQSTKISVKIKALSCKQLAESLEVPLNGNFL